MSSSAQIYRHPETLVLENGVQLDGLQIAFHTYGQLNAAKDNVIWICHALTANSNVAEWWPEMVGPGRPLDPAHHFIVCANNLGSCYGTFAPALFTEGKLPAFVTIRDMVQAQILLRKHLQIDTIKCVVAGSMGGYQSLEWCLAEPAVIKEQFLLVTGAAESAWGIAIHTAQRMAIEADPTWLQNGGGSNGLKAARAIGMITYRSYQQYVVSQTDSSEKVDDLKASSYIRYQGEKLANRFNAKSYWSLTKSMDSHNVARGRGGNIGEVLATINQKTTIVGINSDFLCPTQEQELLAAHIPNSTLYIIDSPYGHDGFLTEGKKVGDIIKVQLQLGY